LRVQEDRRKVGDGGDVTDCHGRGMTADAYTGSSGACSWHALLSEGSIKDEDWILRG
jgi:hypothetical protein